MNKEQAKKEYLQHIYWMECLIKEAQLMTILNKFQKLINIDDLDIDVDCFSQQLSMIKQEIREKSNSLTMDYYKCYIEKLELLINRISEKYSPLVIVDLYFKKIQQLIIDRAVSINEIEIVLNRLFNYVEELRVSRENDYQKVCEKYGTIEYKTLIGVIALSEEHNMNR